MGGTFENRLQKKWRTLSAWAARSELTAFRIYDRDTPEFPLALDRYGDFAQVSEFPSRKARREGTEGMRAEVTQAVETVMGIPPPRLLWKTHVPQTPGGQAFRGRGPTVQTTVQENGLRFEVNLSDFMDTGLFLDHRDTRARVRSEAPGKRLLNLFAYTGSFTVYAAAGGAQETLTVDLSQTYLDWARRNLALNGLDTPAHRRVRADVLEWLEQAGQRPERYELIILDPPSFSRSQAMRRTLEIQRDHARLVDQAAQLLTPGGVLYFSTNLKGFTPGFSEAVQAEELSPRSLPKDFEQKDAHRAWRVRRPG